MTEKKYRYYGVMEPLWRAPAPLDMTDCPPRPEKPEILKRTSPLTGQKQPSTPNEKWLFTVANFTAFGFLSGMANAWWHDFLKVPIITVRQSLFLHMKYLKNPFAVCTAFGLAIATTDWSLEHFRGGNGKRSLREHALIAFNGVAFASYVKSRHFGTSVKLGLFAASIYTPIRWWNVWGEPTVQWRRKSQIEALRIPLDENAPPMPNYHKEKLHLGFYSEDNQGRYTVEKLGAFKGPDYREE
jgi:hypothetical protein